MSPEGAGIQRWSITVTPPSKKPVANRFIGLRLILRVGWSMRPSGRVEVGEPEGEPTMAGNERARLIEELKASGAAARADLERRAAEREANPAFTPWFLPPKPREDARPPAPEPDAAPFT